MEERLGSVAKKNAYNCGLRELKGFEDLPEDLRQELRAICRLRDYKAGQTIAEAGSPPPFSGVVRSGILRMQKSLPDGRQHVVGLLVEGDMFGRAFNGDMHFALEVASDAEIYTFPRPKFEEILLRSPALDRLMLLNLLNELDRARDWMIILANPKVRGRLAGFLLLLCTRFRTVPDMISVANQRLRVKIPLSRPDIAHLLGTRIESVSRGFHALADDGLIDMLRPDLIDLCNLEELAEEAGEPDIGDQASLEMLRLSMRQVLD